MTVFYDVLFKFEISTGLVHCVLNLMVSYLQTIKNWNQNFCKWFV